MPKSSRLAMTNTETRKIRNAGGNVTSSNLASSNAAAILKTDLPTYTSQDRSPFARYYRPAGEIRLRSAKQALDVA
jgi:hypothetical protein